MKNKLLSFLKQRLPSLYAIIRCLYWRINYLNTCLFGTKIQEKKWSMRGSNGKNDWILKYFNSYSQPHRKLLIKKIMSEAPISSILEVGSNCGPNLYLLSKKIPEAKIVGIDINKQSVEFGNKIFKEKNILNVKLFNHYADKLNCFEDKSFDIVFTDATLLCIGPDKIEKVICEMIRITKKAIIVLEQHIENEKDIHGLGVYYKGFYKRNYKNLFQKFIPKEQIYFTKLPKKIWPFEEWEKDGYIIKVKI